MPPTSSSRAERGEATPLVDPLLTSAKAAPVDAHQQALLNRIETHTIRLNKKTDVGLEGFVHNPNCLYAGQPQSTERRMRADARHRAIVCRCDPPNAPATPGPD